MTQETKTFSAVALMMFLKTMAHVEEIGKYGKYFVCMQCTCGFKVYIGVSIIMLNIEFSQRS